MPVKIRLSRHGKKGYPFYHIVVADSRAPRDGRYIERLGMYNPNTNPATIEFDFDRALDWLQKGAQPTDTCRSLLSKKGVFMKKHLVEGVQKNAFSTEVAEQKFESWLKDKESKLQVQKDEVKQGKEATKKQLLEAEAKVKEERAQAISKRLAAEKLAEEPVAEKPATKKATEKPVEVQAEQVAETPVEVVAAQVAEKPGEVAAEQVTETPVDVAEKPAEDTAPAAE